MEADWEVEIGPGAPVIEAAWPGFVDLRLHPECVWQLPEATGLAALAETLIRLNSAASPVWTSKCDVWPLTEPAEVEPDELDAPPECDAHGIGCYIDLLPRANQAWTTPLAAADAFKRICLLLHALPLRCCRVDFVVRTAFIDSDLAGQGITAYLTACGATETEATATLQEALGAFADALCGQSTLQ